MANYAASIMAFLGLDKTGFTRGMADAGREAEQAAGQFIRSGNLSAESQDRLYTSSHRVAAQVSRVTSEMLAGSSASDVFAAALEGAGRSLRLSLGALAAIEVGGVLVAALYKSYEAAKKLHEEIAKLTEPSPGGARFETFNELNAKLTEVRKKYEEAYKAAHSLSLFKFVAGSAPGGAGIIERGEQEDLARLRKESGRIGRGQADKLARENAEFEAKASDAAGGAVTPGLFKAERMKELDDFLPKMKDAFLHKNLALASEEMRKYRDILAEINKKEKEQIDKIARANRERVQGTLDEVAKRPGISNASSLTAAYEGEQAREALKELELARQARDTIGGEEGLKQADIHMSNFERIQNQIVSVKDSVKDLSGLRQLGIDSPKMVASLAKIAENTSNQIVIVNQ